MKWSAVVAAASGALVREDPPASTNPLTAVIKLLTDMKDKGETDKQAEMVMWETYATFCSNTKADKENAIAEAQADIEGYASEIDALKAAIQQANRDIKDKEAFIDARQGDQAASTKVRKTENTKYNKEFEDYSDSIYACEHALETLNKVEASVAGAEATPVLMQLKQHAPAMAWAQISSMIESQDPAYAVEKSNGPVVDMLEELKAKFIQEKNDLQTTEQNRKASYDNLMSTLDQEIKNGESFVASKKKQRGKAISDKGKAEKSKAETEDTKAADEKYLAELNATCATKKSQFEQRQKNREAELTAIGEAITLLTSEATSKGSSQRYGLTQKRTSFVQLGSKGEKNDALVQFLKGRADKLKSKVLAQLAMNAQFDPFVKVRTLIKDLIQRLTEEAASDKKKKEFCDDEIKKNTETRDRLNANIEDLTATKEGLEVRIAKLTEAIENLDAEIADLNAKMEEAAALRKAEKAENEKTIQESHDAAVAVAKALTVLQKMYADIGGEALLQQQPAAPEVFGDENYAGMTGESTGVIGILETIHSDFDELEQTTRSEEEQSASDHSEFMNVSKTDVETKTADRNNKEADNTQAKEDLTDTNADLRFNEEQLVDAEKMWEEIKKQCLTTGVSYEERNAKRQEEIQSLQEALEILGQMGPTF